MPARAALLHGGRTGYAAGGIAQAGRRRDYGRYLFRNPAAYRTSRLRRVHRKSAPAEGGARADRGANLGDVAAVGDWLDPLRPCMSYDAVIIGAGCAGFSAATALADSGARVLIVEARPGLGGRATAFTDPATGERVDNGQHILMGCYDATFAFLRRIGAADRVRWQTGLKVPMIDRSGQYSVLSLPALPSPLHFLAGVLTWEALSWGERLSVLRIGAAIKPGKAGSASAASPLRRDRLGLTVRQWLEQNGQASRLCELFWEPLALAALN